MGASTAIAVRDRARGALLRLAAGDAVGTTVEFRSPGAFESLTDLVGGGALSLGPGQWTDDTRWRCAWPSRSSTAATTDPADQIRRYRRWWKQGYFTPTGRCFDIGTTTRSQLGVVIGVSRDELRNL